MATHTFFDTFIQDIFNPTHPIVEELKDSKFRQYLIDTIESSTELIPLLAEGLISTLKKPQRFLMGDVNFYVACDLYTNTYYICYQNILCIDVDIPKSKWTSKHEYLQFLEDWYHSHMIFDFQIYETTNGFHVFISNYLFDYKQPESIQIMTELGADIYYCVYTYLRGWSIRLNRKRRETHPQIYEYIGQLGQGRPEIVDLIHSHYRLSEEFKAELPCMMV